MKQSQSDIILLCKQLVRELPVDIKWKHVFGHLNEILRWDQLTEVQNLNVLVDSIAKKALMKAIVNREFISTSYPFEEIVLTCGGRKSVGATAANISRWQGYKAARRYYASKKTGARIQDADFDLVYWEGVGRVMKRYPKMYRVWATKQTAGVCGCNEHLSKFDEKVENVCPACGTIGESVAHVAICDDPGRKEMFLGSVDELT